MRSMGSLLLAILAAVAVVAGGACLYVRQEVLDSHAFADRTVAALAKEPVRRVAAREIVVQVIDKGSPDLLAARPLITGVVDTVVSTAQFRQLIHLTAEQAHRLLFDRGGNVAPALWAGEAPCEAGVIFAVVRQNARVSRPRPMAALDALGRKRPERPRDDSHD